MPKVASFQVANPSSNIGCRSKFKICREISNGAEGDCKSPVLVHARFDPWWRHLTGPGYVVEHTSRVGSNPTSGTNYGMYSLGDLNWPFSVSCL